MTLTVNIRDTLEDVSQSEIENCRNVATFDIETIVNHPGENMAVFIRYVQTIIRQ